MTTTIHHHGTLDMFDLPEGPIEALFVLLAREPLDPAIFEGLDPRAEVMKDGRMCIWGNFDNLSWAFQIVTDDPALIDRWCAAVVANKSTEAYAEAVRALAKRRAFWRAHHEQYMQKR